MWNIQSLRWMCVRISTPATARQPSAAVWTQLCCSPLWQCESDRAVMCPRFTGCQSDAARLNARCRALTWRQTCTAGMRLQPRVCWQKFLSAVCYMQQSLNGKLIHCCRLRHLLSNRPGLFMEGCFRGRFNRWQSLVLCRCRVTFTSRHQVQLYHGKLVIWP